MVRKVGGNLEENIVMEARIGRNAKKGGMLKTTEGCREKSSKIEKYALYSANKSFVCFLFHLPIPFPCTN